MKTWIDFDDAQVFAIPLVDSVGGVSVCEGMLIEGPQGWGEFSPPAGVSEEQAARWLERLAAVLQREQCDCSFDDARRAQGVPHPCFG